MTAIVIERNALTEATHRGLSRAWIEFESALVQVPLISRMLGHRLRLLRNRSQVEMKSHTLLMNARHETVRSIATSAA